MLDLVGNPEDWFSCIAAQLIEHKYGHRVDNKLHE